MIGEQQLVAGTVKQQAHGSSSLLLLHAIRPISVSPAGEQAAASTAAIASPHRAPAEDSPLRYGLLPLSYKKDRFRFFRHRV
jgi:hypothetical protein